MLEQKLWLETCSDYIPALTCAFTFLFHEKEKRQVENKGIQTKKRKSRNITTADIDKIVGAAFDLSPGYAGNLRRFFCVDCYNKKKPRNPDICEMEDLALAKIRPFSPNIMKSYCDPFDDTELKINASDEILDGILLLANYALPVSEVLKEKSEFEIHRDIKCNVEEWKQEFEKVIGVDSDIAYWKTIFKYLHQFRADELVWVLLLMLPTIDEDRINKWKDSIENIQSTKTISEIESTRSSTSYLMQFRDELSDLERTSRRDLTNRSEIFDTVSVLDLQSAYFHLDCFKQLSQTRLRPADVCLIYLMAMLEPDYQGIMLEDIEDNLKVKFKGPKGGYIRC